MIDQQGRLFGKVNIIDLAVVLLLVAAIGFFALTRGRGLNQAVPGSTITITVESEQLHPPAGTDIKVGDDVAIWNGSTTLVIGKVDSIEFHSFPSRAPLDGELVVAPDPIQKLARITITGPGLVGKHNITMSNQVVMVGTRFTLRSEKSSFTVAVRELTVNEVAEGAR